MVKERWFKRISCDIEEEIQLGRASQDSFPRKSFPREPGRLGSKRAFKFSKGTWPQRKHRERKGPPRRNIQKCAPRGRCPCAPNFGGRSLEETLHQEGRAREAGRDLAKKKQAQEFGQNYVLYSKRKRLCCCLLQRDQRSAKFSVDSGASMHMMSKRELSSEEMDTVKRSTTPTVVLTANGKVHTHEEAQVFVHD